jgi:hypothetical protein
MIKPVIRYAFVALLLLASFSSFASDVWRSYWSVTAAYGSSVVEACESWVALGEASYGYDMYLVYNGAVTSCSAYKTADDVFKGSTVPVLLDVDCSVIGDGSYSDDGYGNCVQAPAHTCDSGRVAFVEVSKQQDGTFPDSVCIPQSDGDTSFCVYGRSGDVWQTPNDSMHIPYKTVDGVVSCQTQDATEILRLPFAPNSFTGEITDQDTRFTQSDSNYSPPNTVCVANGDGTDTCSTFSQDTLVNTYGSGNVTSSNGTTVIVDTHSGTTQTKTTVENTVDDGNGTSTTTKTTTATTQTGESSQTTTNGNDGSESTVIIIEATDGLTTKTTETDTTYPDGSVTTETTTDTSIEAPDGDPLEEGNCGAPGQPACEVKLAGEDALTDPAATLANSGITEQLDDYLETIGDIGSEDVTSNLLEIDVTRFNLPTLGQCDPSQFDFEYGGAQMNMLTSFCSAYDSTVHPIMRYFVYMLTVFALYGIYISSARRGAS